MNRIDYLQILRQAVVLAKDGDGRSALALLDEALNHPRDESNLRGLRQLCLSGAVIAGNSGDPETAVRFYEHVLEFAPSDPRALYGLIGVYRRIGETKKVNEFVAKCRQACLDSGDKEILALLEQRESS